MKMSEKIGRPENTVEGLLNPIQLEAEKDEEFDILTQKLNEQFSPLLQLELGSKDHTERARDLLEMYKMNLAITLDEKSEKDTKWTDDFVKTRTKRKTGRKVKILTDAGRNLSKDVFLDWVEARAGTDYWNYTAELVEDRKALQELYQEAKKQENLDADLVTFLGKLNQSFSGNVLYHLADTSVELEKKTDVEQKTKKI